MPFPYRSYDLGLRLLRGISPLVAGGDSKVARGVRGRREAARLLAAWGSEKRDPHRPVAWFHAPSVGEGLQARAVMEALRRRRPDMQFVYTHFSPSAEGLARRMPAEVSTYLPWDVRGEVRRVVERLAPDLVAFTKTEVWPGLAREAARSGARVVLVAATLPPDAGRLRWPARALLAPVFRRLHRVMAISPEDAARFRRLGVGEEGLLVTGDPGIDSARERVLAADMEAPHMRPFASPSRPTLVAGSTWAPDEAILLPAVGRLRDALPELRLVIAPHEPGEDHLVRLESELEGRGWATARLAEVESRGEAGDADAILVDRVGVLAHLYRVGLAAYVGGGFHRHGLHSVLEPAAAEVPVVFGPGHSNARAAGELLEEGGAMEVGDADELSDVLALWFTQATRREEAGSRAAAYMATHAGAAARTAEGLLGCLDGSSTRLPGPEEEISDTTSHGHPKQEGWS
jgi:3-deoxy-D-manno-octulosonic-acid transferase